MNKIYSLFALLAALSFPFNAPAQESGFYAGGSAGWSMNDFLELEALKNAGANLDDSDLGWKLFTGYNFNKYLGIEVAYVDLHDSTTKVGAAINNPPVDAEIKAEIDGFTFVGIGRWPATEQLDIFARIGGFYYRAKSDSNAEVLVQNRIFRAKGSTTVNDISYVFGVGAEYEIGGNLALRAEWERYSYKDEDADTDLFSAGILYEF